VNAVAAPPIRHTFTAFGGARCAVIACDASDGDVSAAVADTYAFERQLTRFDPASELSRFNDAAGTRAAVSPLLGELLRVALDAYALSDGLVSAACLPALVAAGYDRTIADVQRRGSTLERFDVAPLPALPDVLDLGTGWARLAPGSAIDLGGVGKGWLADRLCERFDNAVMNLGGDMRVRGDGPDGSGWSVALCDDSVVSVRDAGIATSGTLGRRWAGGHHLIDPHTGSPSTTDIATISVVANTAVHAEVLAKTACLLGSAQAPAWLELHGCARHTLP
jgi:thiamine biosynthesis lipoprotein